MAPSKRGLLFISLLVLALAPSDLTAQQQTPESLIHVITCSIQKVSECLSQELSSGYAAIHIATTILDRPRNTPRGGFGIWRSEDPVVITKKTSVPRRQLIAIIDDLAKREQQLNDAGANGVQLLPNEIVALRSWSGGVTIDGYAALLEQGPPGTKFQYRVLDATANKSISEKIKQALDQGYRSISFVAPAVFIMARGVPEASKIDDYKILQGFESQQEISKLSNAAGQGFRVRTVGTGSSGILTTTLLEHFAGPTPDLQYQVIWGFGSGSLEQKLNDLAQQGFFPISRGLLAITTKSKDYRGLTPPPDSVELILSKPASHLYSNFRVLKAFPKDFQSNLDAAVKDGYEFVEFLGMTDENLVVLGRPVPSSVVN